MCGREEDGAGVPAPFVPGCRFCGWAGEEDDIDTTICPYCEAPLDGSTPRCDTCGDLIEGPDHSRTHD